MDAFKLTDIQAEAILEPAAARLRRLEEMEDPGEHAGSGRNAPSLKSLLADRSSAGRRSTGKSPRIRREFGKETALGRAGPSSAAAPAR